MKEDDIRRLHNNQEFEKNLRDILKEHAVDNEAFFS